MQLHPSRWKRTLMCLTNSDLGATCTETDSCRDALHFTSISRQHDGEKNNGQSASVNVSSECYKLIACMFSLMRYCGQEQFWDELQLYTSRNRIAVYCSMTCLANFYYTVCGEYGEAITLCVEVIGSFISLACYIKCSRNCDGGWAVRFDDDIQSILGFIALYDTLHRQVRSDIANEEKVKIDNFCLTVPVKSFAHYVKTRCLHKLCTESRTQISSLALIGDISSFSEYIETPSSGLNDFSSKLLFWAVNRLLDYDKYDKVKRHSQ